MIGIDRRSTSGASRKRQTGDGRRWPKSMNGADFERQAGEPRKKGQVREGGKRAITLGEKMPEKRGRCARVAKRPLCIGGRGGPKGQVCEGGKEATAPGGDEAFERQPLGGLVKWRELHLVRGKAEPPPTGRWRPEVPCQKKPLKRGWGGWTSPSRSSMRLDEPISVVDAGGAEKLPRWAVRSAQHGCGRGRGAQRVRSEAAIVNVIGKYTEITSVCWGLVGGQC